MAVQDWQRCVRACGYRIAHFVIFLYLLFFDYLLVRRTRQSEKLMVRGKKSMVPDLGPLDLLTPGLDAN